MGYQPMRIADLGRLLAGGPADDDACGDAPGGRAAADDEGRWRLVAEFLEEHRHEPPERRRELLSDEPPPTGDERWNVFLAALAEHLAARDGRRGPAWCERRHLASFWFPFNTRAARAEAIVHAPAAFRRRGVMVARAELEVA